MRGGRDSGEASVLFMVRLAIGLIGNAWHVPLTEKTVRYCPMRLWSHLTVGCPVRLRGCAATVNDECAKVTGQRLSCVSASQCIRFVPESLGGQEIMKQRGPMRSEGAHVHKGAGNSVPVLCSTCCTIEMVRRHGCRSWWEISRYKFPCIFKFVTAGQLLVIALQVTCLSLCLCGARALHFLVRTSCR